MSRSHKGVSRKAVVTAEDLAELAEIHRRLRRMHAGLIPSSSHQLPLMAASATVKAVWAELSGAGWAWTYPASAVPMNGLAGAMTAPHAAQGGPDGPVSPESSEEPAEADKPGV